MYQYKYGAINITIMLGHITSVYYRGKGIDAFDVYLNDDDQPEKVPTKFYDDFMNKLNSYIESQAQ